MTVPVALQQAVRAQGQCEYCHSPEWVCAARFTFDHVLPRSHGGRETLENLALACRRCNERRYNFLTGYDPVTAQEVPLFHPVQERWATHFTWTRAGDWIVRTTPTGRATVVRLDLNDERHDAGFIRLSRALWVQGGWHPHAEDPRLTDAAQ